jgi:hypothetical protein
MPRRDHSGFTHISQFIGSHGGRWSSSRGSFDPERFADWLRDLIDGAVDVAVDVAVAASDAFDETARSADQNSSGTPHEHRDRRWREFNGWSDTE